MITRKRFGQHFLHDHWVIDQIIRAVSPEPHQHVIEIGPGREALTQFFVPPITKQLDLIELDRDLVKLLLEKHQQNSAIRVIAEDVLTVDFTKLVLAENSQFRIVGNLPYNISTPLLFHLTTFFDVIEDMHFMLQYEVAKRIVAKAGDSQYGRLSVMLQYFCTAEFLFEVAPDAFLPPPKVTSAVIRLRPSQQPVLAKNTEVFASVVKTAFSQPRKMIRNNLKVLSPGDWEKLAIDPQVRPETLAVTDYVRIANFLEN